MSFIVSLLGNAYSGKSSLFNKLILKNNFNNSIINNSTNDINYNISHFNNKIIIYDTYNINYNLNKNIILYNKIKNIIETTDLIIYLYDITDNNFYINNKIIKLFNKNNTLTLINKIDKDINYKNFDKKYLYSKKLYNFLFVSIKYNLGIDKIIQKIENKFKDKFIKDNHNNLYFLNKIDTINNKIIIVGKTNVGKTTLFNFMTDYNKNLVLDTKNTTLDIISSSNKENTILVTDTYGVYYNKIRKNKLLYILLDKIKYHNILIYMLDTHVSKNDIDMLNFIFKNTNIYTYILINKIDLIKGSEYKLFKENIVKKLFFFKKNIDILFISIKNYLNIDKLINKLSIKKKNIKKNNINIIKLIKKNTFLYKKEIFNNNIKIKKIIINNNSIDIYINNLNLLNNNYKRFIFNILMKKLNIKGYIIKINYFELI